ncbi:hypothetical protein FN846DRAFT_906271 [Sphaerosporella brunnea]|uniref:Uncharacterized protein n=1 Tax=Sphaerosporella brunnea TaxID=1250544 RepID=A0A5J5EZ74_9PEZI|nr:hypothetical protein FN846DRAFT_906271 [Sphaerosporella brunnea]
MRPIISSIAHFAPFQAAPYSPVMLTGTTATPGPLKTIPTPDPYRHQNDGASRGPCHSFHTHEQAVLKAVYAAAWTALQASSSSPSSGRCFRLEVQVSRPAPGTPRQGWRKVVAAIAGGEDVRLLEGVKKAVDNVVIGECGWCRWRRRRGMGWRQRIRERWRKGGDGWVVAVAYCGVAVAAAEQALVVLPSGEGAWLRRREREARGAGEEEEEARARARSLSIAASEAAAHEWPETGDTLGEYPDDDDEGFLADMEDNAVAETSSDDRNPCSCPFEPPPPPPLRGSNIAEPDLRRAAGARLLPRKVPHTAAEAVEMFLAQRKKRHHDVWWKMGLNGIF